MFKENDIRPLDLKSEQIKYIKADIDYLLERKDKFVDVECPACSKENKNIKFEKIASNILNVQNVRC